MTELLKFAIIASVLIGIMQGIGLGCRLLASKLHVNEKAVTWAVIFVVFIFASYVHLYTEFPEWLERITGVPTRVRW